LTIVEGLTEQPQNWARTGAGLRAAAVPGVFGGVGLSRLGEPLPGLRQRAIRLVRGVAGQLGAIALSMPGDTRPSAASSRSTQLNKPPSAFSCLARNLALVA
jgi:hypothetical protein